MKILKLTKVIAGTLVIASITALNPIGVNAEWKQNSSGWWYTEGSSWSTGWKQIDGKWYYFNPNGYMEHDTEIEGYKLGSDGAWIGTSSAVSTSTATNASATPESQFIFDAYNEWTKSTGIIGGYTGTDSAIVIPSKINGIPVMTIAAFSFIGNDKLTSITIPNSVTYIEPQAFGACKNLTTVTIPSSVTEIGNLAFDGCDNATFYVGNEKIKQLLIDTSRIDSSKIIVNGQS